MAKVFSIPKTRQLHRTTLTVLGLLGASLLVLIVASRVAADSNLPDDAYITLAYAKNLAASGSFIFNHPPATLGTTTRLLALMLAGLNVIVPGVALLAIAIYFSAGCWIMTIWLFYGFRAAWQLQDWHVVIVGFVIAGSGSPLFLGMETCLFLLLLVLSCSLVLTRHDLLAGLASGLLFLARGEGGLLLPVLIGAIALRGWQHSQKLDREIIKAWLRLGAGWLLPIALWSFYAIPTFGGILPDTLAAKQAQFQNGGLGFLQRTWEQWLPTWGSSFRLGGLRWLNPWWLFVLIGLVTALRKARAWLLLIGWMLLYVAGHHLIGVPAYWWYQLPVLFILNLCFALGLIALAQALGQKIRRPVLTYAVVGGLVAGSLIVEAQPVLKSIAQHKSDQRGPIYRRLASWFNEHAQPADSIAYVEIGYLGYYTNNRIIDLYGLVLPDVIPYVAQNDFATGFWLHQPAYFVSAPSSAGLLQAIFTNPRFGEEYAIVATLPALAEQGSQLTIYQRKPEQSMIKPRVSLQREAMPGHSLE